MDKLFSLRMRNYMDLHSLTTDGTVIYMSNGNSLGNFAGALDDLEALQTQHLFWMDVVEATSRAKSAAGATADTD